MTDLNSSAPRADTVLGFRIDETKWDVILEENDCEKTCASLLFIRPVRYACIRTILPALTIKAEG
jgi:hypothetical protein